MAVINTGKGLVYQCEGCETWIASSFFGGSMLFREQGDAIAWLTNVAYLYSSDRDHEEEFF
jgi:hypothetical protein